MKHLIPFVLLSLLLSIGHLQAQVRYGLKVGAGLSGASADFEGGAFQDYVFLNNLIIGDRSELRLAFHLLGFAELDLHKHFGAGLGIKLASRGYRLVPEEGQQDFEDYALRLSYLQLPAYGQFRAGGFYLNLGVYAGMGLTGSTAVTFANEEETNRLQWGNTFDEDLRRFDFGALIEAGASYRNIRLSIGYQHGLVNLIPSDWQEELPGTSLQNRAYYLSVGYIFSARR